MSEDFCPGAFLKEKIIDNIASIQVLVFGNTDRKEAIDWTHENIFIKFEPAPCEHSDKMCSLNIGCIYNDSTTVR